MVPSDLPKISYEDQIRYEVDRIHESNCCKECLAAIVRHLELRPAFEEEGEDGPIFEGEVHVREYGKLFATYRNPSAAWLHVLGSVTGRLPLGFPSGPDLDPKPVSVAATGHMIDLLVSHHPGLDFAAGLAVLPTDVARDVAPLIDMLVQKDLLEPSKLIDLRLVIEAGQAGGMSYPQDFLSSDRLEWWLEHLSWRILPKFLISFRAQPDDGIVPLAYGLTAALANYRSVGHLFPVGKDPEFVRWSQRLHPPTALSEALRPYLTELVHRWDRLQEDERFVWMCLRYATWAHGENPDSLEPGIRRRLQERALQELGRLRVLARQADSADAREKFLRRYGAFGFYDDLVSYVCKFGSIWDALKPLVLAMRSLNQVSVAPNLQAWSEPPLEPVPEWSWIPSVAAGILHAHAAGEEDADPRLEDLRRDFSAFCLERLKSGKEGGPLEPSAVWRYGYIRAARDLRINPRGRGHHILHHARQNDPDAKVRVAADEAYSEMRHDDKLPENRSPRRAILGALWWLKRAHFIDLKGEAALDERGALRTRNREGRKTS